MEENRFANFSISVVKLLKECLTNEKHDERGVYFVFLQKMSEKLFVTYDS